MSTYFLVVLKSASYTGGGSMDVFSLFYAIVVSWSIAGVFVMCLLIISNKINKVKIAYKIFLLFLATGPVVWLGWFLSWPIGKFWEYLTKE